MVDSVDHQPELWCPIPDLFARDASAESSSRPIAQPPSAWINAPSVILSPAAPWPDDIGASPTVKCANEKWRALFRYSTAAGHYGIYGATLSALIEGAKTSISLDTAVRCCAAIPAGVAAKCTLNLILYRADRSEVSCKMTVSRIYARCLDSIGSAKGEALLVTMVPAHDDESDEVGGVLSTQQLEEEVVDFPPPNAALSAARRRAPPPAGGSHRADADKSSGGEESADGALADGARGRSASISSSFASFGLAIPNPPSPGEPPRGDWRPLLHRRRLQEPAVSDGATSRGTSCAADATAAKAGAVCPVVGATPPPTRCRSDSKHFPATARPSSAFPTNPAGAPPIAAIIVTRSNPCVIVAVNDAWMPFFKTHAPTHAMPTREHIIGCSIHCLGSVLVQAADLDILEECGEQRDWGWNEEVRLPLTPPHNTAAAASSARTHVESMWIGCTQFDIAGAEGCAARRFQLVVVGAPSPSTPTKAALKRAKRREAQARYRTKNKLAIAASIADMARSIEAIDSWLVSSATNCGESDTTRSAVQKQFAILTERHARVVKKPSRSTKDSCGGAKCTKRKASALATAAVPSRCTNREMTSRATEPARARRRPSTDGQRQKLLAVQEVASDLATLRAATHTLPHSKSSAPRMACSTIRF